MNDWEGWPIPYPPPHSWPRPPRKPSEPFRFGIRDCLLAVACFASACASLTSHPWAPLGGFLLFIASVLAGIGALRGQVPAGLRQFLTVPLILFFCNLVLSSLRHGR